MQRGKVSNSFRDGRKYFKFCFFFQFFGNQWEDSNRRREERCKDGCVTAEQADETNEKDADDVRRSKRLLWIHLGQDELGYLLILHNFTEIFLCVWNIT